MPCSSLESLHLVKSSTGVHKYLILNSIITIVLFATTVTQNLKIIMKTRNYILEVISNYKIIIIKS